MGIVKGVIAGFAPTAPVIDLCHEVAVRDVRAAAFQLRVAVPFFPQGSLFVCVVDPGVGSGRRVLWARTARHQFLAPDNGLLSWIAERVLERRAVTNESLFLKAVSATFHGRDVFAPVAARLWGGLPPDKLGARVTEAEELPFPRPVRRGNLVQGRVLGFDRFGNAVTNIGLADAPGASAAVFMGKHIPVRTHYGSVKRGEPVALLGSAGFIELSVSGGDFMQEFSAKVDDPVEVRSA